MPGRVRSAELLDAFNRRLPVQAALEDAGQGRHGVIKIKFVAQAVEDSEALQKRSEVLGPEHKTNDVLRLERYNVPASAERIDHASKAVCEPPHEPVAVKRRDIRSARY